MRSLRLLLIVVLVLAPLSFVLCHKRAADKGPGPAAAKELFQKCPETLTVAGFRRRVPIVETVHKVVLVVHGGAGVLTDKEMLAERLKREQFEQGLAQ